MIFSLSLNTVRLTFMRASLPHVAPG
jgi:hypothetical protein